MASSIAIMSPIAAAAQRVAVDMKIGVSRALLDVGPGPSMVDPGKARTAVTVGSGVELSLTNAVAARVELLLAPKGKGNTLRSSFHGPYESYLRSTYIEMPLLVSVGLPLRGSSLRARILSGAAPAFEVSCKISAVPPPGTTLSRDRPAWPCDDDYSWTDWFDFGAVVGAAVSVELRAITFSIEGRYTHGLSDVSGVAFPADQDDYAAIKNRVVAVFLGVSARP
jgi:hypothetical protein